MMITTSSVPMPILDRFILVVSLWMQVGFCGVGAASAGAGVFVAVSVCADVSVGFSVM